MNAEQSAATYAVDCGYLVEVVNEHTCGAGDFGQHEPGCGMVPVAPIEELLRADARLAAVEALADEWDAEGRSLIEFCDSGRDVFEGETLKRCATNLRAALHSDPSDPS